MILLLGLGVRNVVWVEPQKEPRPEPTPIVVALFTEGKEVVIEPRVEKLKAHGITLEQLEHLRGHRLSQGDWKVEIEGKRVDLTAVAKITVRNLVAKPFTVVLPDGREAVIVPDAKKVGRYLVTGDSFERDVRNQLQYPFHEDPLETCVLGGIPVPGGHVPNAWGPDHVHISTGEPLKSFAKVEIRGKTGPQAADLAHMRAVRKHLETGLQLAEGMSREEFEKRFGPGQKHNPEPDPHFTTIPSWQYQVGKGKLQVRLDNNGSKVEGLSGWTDQQVPLAPSPDSSRVARAMAHAERDLLFVFLTKRFSGSSVADKNLLRVFLQKTASELRWTDKERKQMLGD